MSSVIVTPTAPSRWRSARPFLAIAGVVVMMFVAFVAVTNTGFTNAPLSIDNPNPRGIRAIAQVLEDQGFDVVETTEGVEALALMQTNEASDPTLVVMQAQNLSEEADEAYSQLKRVIVVEPQLFESKLHAGVEQDFDFSTSELDDEHVKEASKETREQVFSGPTAILSAQSAGAISYHHLHLKVLTSDWDASFPLRHITDNNAFLFAEKTDGDTYRAVFASADIFRNDEVANFGNAALIINALSAHSTVPIPERGPIIFLHPQLNDTLATNASVAPKFVAPLLTLSFVSLCVWGLSRGLRLGRLVQEDLPSYVPAAETITGRGRLLYANREVQHTARLLRRDTARRLARRLSLPASTSPDTLRSALGAAGASPQRIEWLWFPIPHTDSDLRTLTEQLSALEKEIRP